MRMTPHQFNTKVKPTQPYNVIIGLEAYSKMALYIEVPPSNEIGWLGTAEKDGNTFYIREVFLAGQEVTPGTTEITTDGLSDLAEDILTRKDGVDVWNNVRFWGHSHVTGGTSPSYTDEEQMQRFITTDHPWFIRGIFNKHGRAEFTIFLYDVGIVVEDVPWTFDVPLSTKERARIVKEIENKCKFTPYEQRRTYIGGGGYGRYWEDDDWTYDERTASWKRKKSKYTKYATEYDCKIDAAIKEARSALYASRSDRSSVVDSATGKEVDDDTKLLSGGGIES
jgi:hypothetical protein